MKLISARSLLFTPATRPERFLKAGEANADGIILDLEDAVPLDAKDEARQNVILAFKKNLFSAFPSHFISCVRINSIQTPAGLKDILAFCEAKVFPDVFVFPKVEDAQEIKLYEKLFNLPQDQDLEYLALIETALGLQEADKIASSSQRLSALAFGGADLASDLTASLDFESMLFARSRIVQAAKIKGLAVFDVPYLDIQDDQGLDQESLRVKALGFNGKFAIHPKQIKTIHHVFNPGTEELTQAQAIVKAYEAAQGQAVQLQGKMIDVPVYKNALRILALNHHDTRK